MMSMFPLVHMIKNNAFFERVIFDKKTHFMAANRAARRFLNSNKVKNAAKKMQLTIKDGVVS